MVSIDHRFEEEPFSHCLSAARGQQRLNVYIHLGGGKKEYVCSRRMHVRYVQLHPGDIRGCIRELYVLH